MHLIPGAFLVLLHNSYQHSLSLDIGFAVALVAALTYARHGAWHLFARVVLFLVTAGVIFYLATGAYLVFVALSAVFECVRNRRAWLASVLLVLSLFIPLAYSLLVFGVSAGKAYASLIPPEYDGKIPSALVCLWLSCPGLVIGVLAWEKILARKMDWEARERMRRGDIAEESHSVQEKSHRHRGGQREKSIIRRSLLASSVLAVVLYFSFPMHVRTLIEIDYHATNEEWEKVLVASKRLPVNLMTHFAFHDTNRALFHLGVYPERMFEFPQTDQLNTLMPPEKLSESMHACLKFSDLFYDLGLISESEHLAYEALSSYGNHPAILKRLVQTNALKGRAQAARQFLNVLQTYPAARKWAKKFRTFLDSEPLEEPGMRDASSRMLRTDYAGMDFTPETVFNWLLKDSRENRMAFEYLMAHYLLTGQLEEIVRNVPRLTDLGYKHIPTLYEEAILVYMQTTGQQHPNLRGHRIRQETHERFRQFNRLLVEHMNDLERGKTEVLEEFASSYWTYCAFSLQMLKMEPETVAEASS